MSKFVIIHLADITIAMVEFSKANSLAELLKSSNGSKIVIEFESNKTSDILFDAYKKYSAKEIAVEVAKSEWKQ